MIGGYIPPAPQPAVETRVRRELKRIDPMLDIVWQPGWVLNQHTGELEGRYVLVSWWNENDPRHRDPDCNVDGKTYDLIGAFCRDIHDAQSIPEDPENVLVLLKELLASCDGERVPHLMRFKEVSEHNRRQREVLRASMEDEVEEAAERAAREVFGKELY